MSTAKESKTQKKKRKLLRRRGIILIALLALMILVVNLIVFSYSWFTPTTTDGIGLAFDNSEDLDSIRSERCTFSTYRGTLVTAGNWEQNITFNDVQNTTYRAQGYYIDQVAYGNTPIANNVEITIPKATTQEVDGEEVTVPGRVYFRTNIQNTDTEHPSVISLYHHEFPGNLGLAVTYPSNTYFFNDFGTGTNHNYPDCWILRNAYVKVKDDADIDGPGLLQVDWFVENFDTAATKSIRVTRQTTGVDTPIEWLYLMYN